MRRYIFLITAIVSTILLTIIVLTNIETLQSFSSFGYPGIFLMSMISNATIIFPLPGLLAPVLGGAVFSPLIVGLVSGAGQAVGELSGYMVGYYGHEFVDQHKIYKRIEKWMRRWGSLFIFIFAAIPNFLFDLGGIAAGATGMPVWRFLLAVFLGKTARAILLAYLGSHIPTLLGFLV